MSEAAAKLIKDMQAYQEASYLNRDVDFASEFGERVRTLGERELLVYLFRTFADSKLSLLLDMFRFAWCDLSFDTWMRILEDLSAPFGE